MKKYLLPFVVFPVLVLGFQNCGYFSTSGVFVGSSCGGGSDADALPAFQSGYHQFFINNACSNCHAPGGIKADSPFGAPDAATAFEAFSRIGPDAIQNKLAGGHQGYNIANLQSELDAARSAYEAAGGGGFCEDGVNTTGGSRVLFFDNTAATDLDNNTYFPLLIEKQDIFEEVEYDLGEPPFEPSMPGVSVKMEITVRYSDSPEVPRRPTGYEVQNIQVKSLNGRVRVAGINVLLNNSNQQVSTFQNVDFVVIQGDFWQTVSGAETANFFLDNFSNSDLWQIQFGEIEEL